MGKWIKNILIILVVGFCLYYLVTRPDDAAAAVKSVFYAISQLGTFFTSLASR